METKLKKIVVAACILLPSHTIAEGQLFGEGYVKCHEFLADVENDFPAVQAQMSWVNGYLSGRSLTEKQPMNTEKHKFFEVLDYLKDYCEKNPTKHFVFGVEQLYVDMRL